MSCTIRFLCPEPEHCLGLQERSTPQASAEEPYAAGRPIVTVPASPSTIPAAWWKRGSDRSSTTAITVLKIGTEALSIPVSAESMCCCAIGNSTNGTTTQTSPSSTTRG